MKHIHRFAIFCALLFALSACDTTPKSTPYVQGSTTVFRTNAAGVRDTISYADTIQVGDTVRMHLLLYGQLNTLTYFTATCDTSAIDMGLELADEQWAVLTKDSDPANGKLVFDPEQVIAFTTWLRYSPRRSGVLPIELVIGSNAGKDYSPQAFSLSMKVR